MAVEIPVVVDIEGAFNDAAKRVRTVIKSLESQISSNALNLKLKVDKSSTMAVGDLLKSPLATTKQLKTALADLETQIRQMQARGQFQPGQLTGMERDLLNLHTQLKLKIQGTTDVLNQFGNAVARQAPKVNTLNNSLRTQTGLLSSVKSLMASYVSVYGLLRFAKQIRDVTGELEFQRVALGRLIQDEEYGATLFERIKEKAKESPFRIKDLTTYTKQLAAFRVEQENLFPTMNRLADISAGLGVSMDRLILAYGQVRAASVLRGQELRQFTEAGIPLVDLLAEKFSELNGKAVRTADVFDLISKRAVPFSMISEIFEDLTEKGGMFYKMQENQAQTLKGRWEKLKDAYDIGLQSIGETKTFERYNDALLKSLNYLANHLQYIPKLIEAAGAAWAIYTIATTRSRIATRKAMMAEIQESVAKQAQQTANIRGIKFVDAYTYALVRQNVATNALSRTFWRLWAAIVANPIGAILSAVGAVVAAFTLWNKKTDEVKNSFEDLDKLIEDTSSGLKDVKRVDSMIKRYETLASKVDRNVKENNLLYQTMTQLQDVFPEVAVGIDNETDSLESQVETLREMNKLKEEEVRLRAETKLGELEVELADLEKDREKNYKKRLKEIQNAARLERELATDNLYEDSSEWKESKKRAGELSSAITEQDEKIVKLQKRIESLNRILTGESSSALNAWQRQIQSMRDITVGDISSPLFTDQEIEKWETLDVALDAIAKAKKKAQEQEEKLSQSIINQTGEIREQIQSELDWAKATKEVAESIEEFFKTPTIFAKDIMDNFPKLLVKNIEDEMEKLSLGEFLISDKDLVGLREATDVTALLESKISSIEKAIEAVNSLSLSPEIPDEIKEETKKYKENLEQIYQILLSLQERYGSTLSDIAKDVKDTFPSLMEDAYKSVDKSTYAKEGIFSKKELMGVKNAIDLYGVWSTKIDAVRKAKKHFNKVFSTAIDEQTRANAKAAIASLDEQEKKLLEFISRYGFVLSGGGGGSTGQDPWIILYKNRMKFMQDFQKGVEDLDKYLSHSESLGREQGIMKGRGLSLGIDTAQLKGDAEELRRWYSSAIDDVVKKIQSMGGRQFTGLSVTEILAKDLTGRKIQKYQELLQDLWNSLTDFDTSQMKKSIDDALKKLSDEIKRSETARNFYNDILGLTGDEQLAATLGVSIYGDIGKEFNERLQEELNKALETLDAGAITDELRKAFSTQNFSVILENLDKFPEEWQKRLKEMAASSEKFQADMVKNLLKSLEKFKSYGDQQVELSKQTARRTANIQALNIPQTQKNKLLEQNARKEAEESAKIAYEAFRDTPMYIELFDDLDAASTRMLENMRKNLEDMRENWKALSPRELKELQSKINDLDEQIAKKNPFKALISSIKEYRDLQKVTTRREAESNAITANDEMVRNKEILELYQKQYEESVAKYGIESKEAKQAEEDLEVQATVTDLAIEQAKNAQKTASAFKEAGSRIQKAAEGLETWSGYITESLGGIGQIVSTFASDDVSETFGIISEGLGKTVSGASELAKGLGKILTGDIVGGVVSAIKGAGDFIAGTFGAASQLKIKALDKEIEKQSRLIDDLSYSYSRLENAMAKSFGSEYIYNYNKQLENLEAQAEAYRAQAEAEQSKGKKADEDKVREYLDSARDAEDQIADMRTQLSEFFAGTDLTSAAEDFANAWIEAYKEFGSTTDAMSEKFNDMIESMINRSLAAKIMQEMLQPVFDQIDTMSRDGLLATDEIAAIAALAQERIPLINDAMTNLMTSLASAGLDVRASTAGFHGISKDIAGASEESILGLAAAINTQNFYISYVPTISENVSQILAAMTGGVSPTAPVETNEAGEVLPSVQRMVYDHLPNMDANLSEMLRLFRSVITTKTGSTNTNYVAIK